jgi:hypothetical protein
MIDRDSLRKMCEYPITPTLIGEIEPVKETARERAHRRWNMKDERSEARCNSTASGTLSRRRNDANK